MFSVFSFILTSLEIQWIFIIKQHIQVHVVILKIMHIVPPAALICRVDSKDIQLFFIFFWVQAEEVLPVLVQIVDQVPVEAVFGDNVDRPWERQHR